MFWALPFVSGNVSVTATSRFKTAHASNKMEIGIEAAQLTGSKLKNYPHLLARSLLVAAAELDAAHF